MERGSTTRWLLLGLAVALLLLFGPKLFGGSKATVQPLGPPDYLTAEKRGEAATCAIAGPRFSAELSTHGASLRRYQLTEPKYQLGGQPIELESTKWEGRAPLRMNLVAAGASDAQVAYHDLEWKLAKSDGTTCELTYADETTELTKTVSATGKPYELKVTLRVKNLAKEAKTHRATLEQAAFRRRGEIEGSVLRPQSEWQSEVLVAGDKTERFDATDFEPSDFEDKEFTAEKWRRAPGAARFAAVSSSYLSQIVVPLASSKPAAAETLVEEFWASSKYPEKEKDPGFGYTYRARVAWDAATLQPGEELTYEALSYMGPKERDLLAALGHGTPEVIQLGWFSAIAKLLVSYLYVLHGAVASWGWAICLLTITVRILLFPLSLAQIRSAVAMRKLKPDMDAINAKYKDDAAMRGLALQELWRKNKVANPMVGCLPAVLQMPVWFALYSTLQTAVELYHVPFGPFIPDLSQPGKFFIIPIVLGASSFLQQKLMPMQGDPAQQKMMLYMMPAIFTFMMLFLPAGLGVYMLTNTWLGIAQQVVVERYMKDKATSGEITVREIEPRSKKGDDSLAEGVASGKATKTAKGSAKG